MPRRTGYSKSRAPRSRAPRRRMLALADLNDRVTKSGFSKRRTHPSARGIPQMLYDAAFNPRHPIANMVRNHVNKKAPPRKPVRSKNSHTRHQELKSDNVGNSVPKGKGKGYAKPNGRLTTHGKGKVPSWKLKRLGKYRNSVYQTVLISKSNRLPASQNLLERSRYPIKAPECLDSERIQAMVFSPFCSHFSGVHTTMYQKIRADGTDLDHDTTNTLDVIQNRVDGYRHELGGIGSAQSVVDGSTQTAIQYEGDYAGGAVSAANARSAANLVSIHSYYDQLVKGVNVNLVFMASRAFDMRISVSVVRLIKPTTANTLDSNDKKMLLNNLNYKGIEWSDYRVEWNHQFTLRGLKKDKKPPTYSVNKKLKTNFLQSNTFESNNTAQAMVQSATTLLGKDINVRQNETADGDVSSQFFVLIKYRKVAAPQQFTYTQVIESDAVGEPTSTVELPAISESSLDIPTVPGSFTSFGGAPFNTSQGDESKGSFYVHGKLVYEWGFRKETESIPSVVSSDATHVDFKKVQSLMIDPTFTTDDTHGIYTESPNHVQLAADTSATGP